MIITCPYCKKKYFRIKKILDKKFKNTPNDERIIICSKCKGRFFYNHGPDYIQKNKLKKPKFNIEIFFESFAKINLPKYIIDRPHMLFDYALSKGFGYEEEKDFKFGREWINPEYSSFENPKKGFNNLSKLIEYIPLMQIIDNDPGGVFICKGEFGYLSSKKSNISFLINSFFFHGDGHDWQEPQPISIFKKFDNKKIKELSKILLNSLKKTGKNEKVIHSTTNLVNLNDKFKWDRKLLEIVFKEDLKSRKKYKKEQKKNGLENPDWYYNIWFFLTPEKKMISKDPTYSNFLKAYMSLS